MSSQKACRDLEPLLSAYVDHEATTEEMAIVERHTRSCAACASRLNQYATLVPRLEANIRAGLFEAELAGGRVKQTRFRDLTERMPRGASPVRLLSRAATLVFILAMAFVAAAILARAAPAVQSLAVTTGAQPSPPATPATLNLPNLVEPERAGAGCIGQRTGRSGCRGLPAPRRVGRGREPRECAGCRAQCVGRSGCPDAAGVRGSCR